MVSAGPLQDPARAGGAGHHHGPEDPARHEGRDVMVRTALFEAATVMLTRSTKSSRLKAWALDLVKRRGTRRAIVALARKLGVVLHRIWVDGSTFRCAREGATMPALITAK